MVSQDKQEREAGRRPLSLLQTVFSVVFIALLTYSAVTFFQFSRVDAATRAFSNQIRALLTGRNIALVTAEAAGMLILIRILVHLTQRFDRGWLAWKLFKKNIQFLPLEHSFLRYPFIVVFLLNMPFIAGVEEFLFRHGLGLWPTITVFDIAWRSLAFGLVHCISGNSVRMGLILSLFGFWLSHQYLAGGLALATLSHCIFDFLLFTLILALWIFKGQHPLAGQK